jgi:Tol biopolymer transport system component
MAAAGFCLLILVASACGKGGSTVGAGSKPALLTNVTTTARAGLEPAPASDAHPATHEPRQTPNDFSPDLGITVGAAGVTLRVFPLDEHEQAAPDMKPLLDVRAEAGKDGGVVVSLGLADAFKGGGVFVAVRFDAAQVHPTSFMATSDVSKGALSLAVLDHPGYVPVGFAALVKGGSLPAGELGRLTFAAGAAQSGKRLSAAPRGNQNLAWYLTPTNLENGDVRLTFREGIVGDYNHDGLVSIGDLAALALYFLTNTADSKPTDPAYWVDGNLDGEVNIADLQPVADYYGNQVVGYNVYKDLSSVPLPNPTDPTPGAPTIWRPTQGDLANLTPPETGDIPYPYEFIDHPPHVATPIKYTVAPVAPNPPPDTGYDVGVKTIATLNYRGDLTVPAAPTGLTLTAKQGEVDLSWNANTEPDLAGYRLYIADTAQSAAPTCVNQSGPITATTYAFTNLTAGRLMYFRVTAIDTNVPPNESPFSNEVSGYPTAPPATGHLAVDKDYGPMPLSVIYDARGCIPEGVTVDHYNWRYDASDSVDLVTPSPFASHTYRKMGVYMPTVEVVDTNANKYSYGVFVTVVGKIAFMSVDNVAKTQDISVIYSDGTHLTNVTSGTLAPVQFDLSPDGQHILISAAPASAPQSTVHLYVANADGSGVKQITNGMGELDPKWSHKGDTILYTQMITSGAPRAPMEPQVYRCNADGSNPINLSRIFSDIPMVAFANVKAAWSPDDSKVAFASTQIETVPDPDNPGNTITKSVNWIIYMVSADGSNQVNLTKDFLDVSSVPLWLNGSTILFEALLNNVSQLYTVDVTGTPPAAFIDGWTYNQQKHAASSPDGKWVYFDSNRWGIWHIYVKDSDGILHRFDDYNGGAPQHDPSPSPDGTMVTFTQEDETGMEQIWICDVWGRNATLLTTGTNYNFSSKWFPLPPTP